MSKLCQALTQTLLGVHRYRTTVFLLAGAFKGKYQCVQRLLITIVFCSWECSCHTTEVTAPSCELPCFLRGLHQHLCYRPLHRLSICEGLSWPLPLIKRLNRVKRWLEQSSVTFLYFAFPNSKPRLRLLPLFVSGRGSCAASLTNNHAVNLPKIQPLIAFH